MCRNSIIGGWNSGEINQGGFGEFILCLFEGAFHSELTRTLICLVKERNMKSESANFFCCLHAQHDPGGQFVHL